MGLKRAGSENLERKRAQAGHKRQRAGLGVRISAMKGSVPYRGSCMLKMWNVQVSDKKLYYMVDPHNSEQVPFATHKTNFTTANTLN